jgi:hypothetical protein
MHTKKLYSAISFFAFSFSIILKIASIALLIFCIYMYEENPFVFIILAVVSISIFMQSGEEVITIFEDRVEQKTNSIVSIIFKKRDAVIFIKNISNTYKEKKPSGTKEEIGVAMILLVLFGNNNVERNKSTIFIKLKNGAVQKIETTLSNKKVNEIVHNLNVVVK